MPTIATLPLPEPPKDKFAYLRKLFSSIGLKVSTRSLQSDNYVAGTSGWRLTPTDAEINVPTAILELNIPDTTTANSFHVDSNGNAWWGANKASGYTAANAYILATGAAVFKSVSVGGTTFQYAVGDNGTGFFGDATDGAVTISVNTTLTADKFYTNLTVNSGVTLNPGGYIIRGQGTLTLNGTIARNGNNGTNGVGGDAGGGGSGAGGAGGAALADGYLKGSVAGQTGGAGSGGGAGGAGVAGTNTSNSLGVNGSAGGAGGVGGIYAGGAAGGGGTRTAANVSLNHRLNLETMNDFTSTGASVKYDNSAGSGSGGGGGYEIGGAAASGGGGSGSSGGIIPIFFRSIVISATGSITANGGNGGNGGSYSGTGTGGGGGGGGGGAGGVVVLAYNSYSNAGSVTVNGGTAGALGTGSGGALGQNGTAGTVGTAGTTYLIQIL